MSFTVEVEPGSGGRRRRAGGLAHVHATVANRRRDGLHKLTIRLAKQHSVVVVEDLNVAGVVGNRRLARAIADLLRLLLAKPKPHPAAAHLHRLALRAGTRPAHSSHG